MGHYNVAVIGAGPAGCMLARLLHRGGTDVTVFEGEASFDARSQGGTLDLHTGTGLAAIKEAGLFDEFLRHARYEGQYMAMTDKDLNYLFIIGQGKVSRATRLEERPEIDRAQLRKLLIDSLPEGMIRWGHRLLRVEDDGRLVFEDPAATAAAAEDSFDLVVGADGAWSKVRPLATPELRVKCTGIAMHELVISDAETTAPAVSELVNRGSVFSGADGCRLAVQQLGDGSIGIQASWLEEEAGWMAPDKCGYDARNPDAAVQAMLDGPFASWCPLLREALDKARGGRCQPRSLYMLPVKARWAHKPGFTLVGDAAHLMTVYAGEGVNQALDDARRLARAVNRVVVVVVAAAALDEAVRRFEADMFDRVGKVQELTEGAMNDWMFTPGAPRTTMARTLSRHARMHAPWLLKPVATAGTYMFYYLRLYLAG